MHSELLLLSCHLLIPLQLAVAQLVMLLLWLLRLLLALLLRSLLLPVLLLLLPVLSLLLVLQLLLHQMLVCSFSNLRHRRPAAPHRRRTGAATARPL
jgi:hypothetical protein